MPLFSRSVSPSPESSTSGFGRSVNAKRMSEKACVKCVGLTPIYVCILLGRSYTNSKSFASVFYGLMLCFSDETCRFIFADSNLMVRIESIFHLFEYFIP